MHQIVKRLYIRWRWARNEIFYFFTTCCLQSTHFLQTSYVNLDLDELCSEDSPSTVHDVMKEWGKAESPSVHWYKKFKEHERKANLHKISLDQFPPEEHDKSVPLVYGLAKNEALDMCKKIYKNNIAKVTVQIADNTVLMTMRERSVTFPEQLSIMSM